MLIPSTSSNFSGLPSSFASAWTIALTFTFCTGSPLMALLVVFISTPAFLDSAATERLASRRKSSNVGIRHDLQNIHKLRHSIPCLQKLSQGSDKKLQCLRFNHDMISLPLTYYHRIVILS